MVLISCEVGHNLLSLILLHYFSLKITESPKWVSAVTSKGGPFTIEEESQTPEPKNSAIEGHSGVMGVQVNLTLREFNVRNCKRYFVECGNCKSFQVA